MAPAGTVLPPGSYVGSYKARQMSTGEYSGTFQTMATVVS